MAIHTKDIMDDSFVATVKNAKIGEEQFCLFVKERFIDRSKPVTNPLKKNNLPAYLVLQLRRLCWKTRQNSNCRKRTAVHCLSNPWRKPGWVFFVWKSTLDTIFFRPRTAARRTKNWLAEVPATSNRASIDTSSRCRNSRWSGYCSNAGAKKIAHLRQILQYSICSVCPQATGECQACWPCVGCLSRWFIKEITVREARCWTTSQSSGIYKNSKRQYV